MAVGAPSRVREGFGRPADPRALTAAGWVVGLIVTALIVGSPYLLFGYYSPALHLVLDSVDACVALLLTYLLYGRFTRTRRLQDLLLAEGLFLLAVAGLGLSLFIGYFNDLGPRSFGVWLPLLLRVAAAALVVASALVGRRPAGPDWLRRVVLAPLGLLLLAFIVLWFNRAGLPVALNESAPAAAQRPFVSGHPLLVVAQAFAAACFLVASVSFTAQAGRRHDELIRWLGPACALAGFGRVNYVLFPSLYSDWLYTGDLLRTGSYLLLLVGAAREIGQYWSASAAVAVLDDRRRLARELHDGVVQELGYIRAEAHGLSEDVAARRNILDASDRALDEARAAVDALGRGSEEPLGYTLHRAARDVADRYGGRVVVELDNSVEANQSQRHALTRITREAVSNALRHGSAEHIHVTLERDLMGGRLVVRDDGAGFDVSTASGGTGFGLTSMRERALGLPGTFEIQSEPGEGTEAVVTW
ncbi:MAG: sensor histidine kinase [Nocardioidaceae bacterium]